MDECIGLAVIALNEAETLHRVEELHRALDALASGLALMPPPTPPRPPPSPVPNPPSRPPTTGRRLPLSLHFIAAPQAFPPAAVTHQRSQFRNPGKATRHS